MLRLLAAGLTNAQIGAELFISPKTASVHVSNILRKLGASGRAQAAATAERAGLLGASAEMAKFMDVHSGFTGVTEDQLREALRAAAA